MHAGAAGTMVRSGTVAGGGAGIAGAGAGTAVPRSRFGDGRRLGICVGRSIGVRLRRVRHDGRGFDSRRVAVVLRQRGARARNEDNRKKVNPHAIQ